MVHGFGKTQKKTCLGERYRLCTFVDVYFVVLIFFFLYINDKEKTNLTTRSSHSNLLFLKIVSVITSNKAKREPTGTSSNIHFIY